LFWPSCDRCPGHARGPELYDREEAGEFLAAEKSKGLPVSYADLGPGCLGQENAKPLWKAAEALFEGRYREKINLSTALANLYEGRPIR